MKAVISVTGTDNIGIIAKVAGECSLYDANIQDISQTVLSEYFAMIMLVDITNLNIGFGEFADKLKALGESNGLAVSAMHEDIFNSMHRI